MKKILIVCFFYIENCILIRRESGSLRVFFSLLMGMFLIVKPTWNMLCVGREIDFFNLSYVFIGLLLLTYNLYVCFLPAYQKHRNLIKFFGYKDIYDYYSRQE